MQAGLANNLVDRDRRGTEQPEYGLPVLIGWVRPGRLRPEFTLWSAQPRAGERLNCLQHISRGLDQGRALSDQQVAPLRARIERRARHSHHLAPRFVGQSGGDERSRFRCGFDNHRPQRHSGNDPIAPGKVPRLGFAARRLLGDQQPTRRDRFLQFGILWRIGNVDAAGDHAYRSATERALMRGRIDPAGKSRNHGHALIGHVERQLAREADGRGRRIASADDRHRRPFEQGKIATHDQRRRSRVDFRKQRGIKPLAEKQIARAQLFHGGDFAGNVRDRRKPGRLSAAANGEFGYGLKRGTRRAEAPD